MPASAPPTPHDAPKRPRRLRAGDQVAVVAPAGPIPADLLEKAVAILSAWGLEVRLGPHVGDRHPTLDYLAGADADRARDFTDAWLDPDVAAVFCARGGYGSLRLIDLIDWDALAAVPPKVFTGSSDITALHQVIGTRFGIPTVFGAMVVTSSFVDDPVAQEHLRRMLFEPTPGLVLSGPRAEPLRAGLARGTTVGGNLSLVVSARGVPDVASPPPGSIALLEDVGEQPYRIDHFVTHLRRTGWFAGVAGIALGSWVDCGDPDVVRSVLTDRLGDLGIPIIWELGFGHCEGQLAVPLGTTVELVSDPHSGTASLTLVEPVLG
ncbi:S66 peptidase family protein [Actinopolymorpha alba]|uniref:S66 peptidase family protein n=1 Tax=Actinopolymorpha alba TaxID=533267 RepID=UPI0003A7A8C0|nr:LD-carboxypeptidase [Actinopolymorpha alba]